MKDFFTWVASVGESFMDMAESIISLVVSLIQSLFDLIEMLPSVVSMVTASIGFLPSMLTLFAALSITVSIIYLIAGRNNN